MKQIIDALTLANQTSTNIFSASRDGLILFAALNLGLVFFSRASGAVLVPMIAMVGYALKIWPEGDMTVGEFSMVAGLAILLIEAARG